MTALQRLEFEGLGVRIMDRSGNPWFVLSDACDVLGISNSRDAASKLDDDEKDVANADTLGGVQQITVINESGLYSLILRSRKPAAKRFKKWVTSEVLPAIRKTGGYQVQSQQPLDIVALAAQVAQHLPQQIVRNIADEPFVVITERIHKRVPTTNDTSTRRIMGAVIRLAKKRNALIFPVSETNAGVLALLQEDIDIIDTAIDQTWERFGLPGRPEFRPLFEGGAA